MLRKHRSIAVVFGFVCTLAACASVANLGPSNQPIDAQTPPTPPPDYDNSIPAGNVEDIAISPTSLDLGGVRCGGSLAAPQLVTIKNNGDVAVSFDVKLGDASQLKLVGTTTGSIAPHSQATVSVDVTPNVVGAIETDVLVAAGKAFQQIHTTATGQGGVIVMAPATVSFGEVRDQSGGAPLPINITNTGNADVVIGSFTGAANDLDLTWPGKPQSFIVPAGGSATISATFAAGAKQADVVQAQLMPQITGAICADIAPITLKGQRIDTNITLTPVDFGTQDCNVTTAGTRDIVLTNFAPDPIDYTLVALADASFFTIVDAGPGNIPGNQGTSKITVGVKAVGSTPKLFTEDLQVNVTGQDAGLKTVNMKVDVHGAVINVAPVTIDTFYSNGFNTDYRSFAINNTGNDTVGLAYGFDRTEGGTAWIHPDSGTVKANSGSNLTIGFRPNQTDGWHQANFPITHLSGGVICNQPELPIGRGFRPTQ